MDESLPDPEALAEGSTLTARQVEVLQLREGDRTQREVAERFGTTASNVSRIERAAEENVEKARRTLEVVQVIRAPVRIQVAAGTEFDDLVTAIYEEGDRAGIKVDYCRPELYTHVFTHLGEFVENNAFTETLEVGITEAGEVTFLGVTDS